MEGGSSEGVSRWLFVGQLAASTGFTAYSYLVRNWVFVVTNALMLVNGLLGLFIVLAPPAVAARRRGRSPRRPASSANGVSRCGRVRPRPTMCSTITPRAKSASAMSDRWHRHGTASAHMIATGPSCASERSPTRPSSNSADCM